MVFNGQKSTPYIVDILYQHGIEQVIICPGSRNAPLTLAFARHGKFNCISIVDERSAGYFALGLTLVSKKMVAIVCTSGTATLNLSTAIAEAYHQQIPLMVITADRPVEWIGQQDGQAINQKNIYSNIIAKSYSLKGELYCADDLWYTQRMVNEACSVAKYKLKPVHINCSFAEPLYNENYLPVVAKKIEFIKIGYPFFAWDALLQDKKNVLLVIGQLVHNEEIIEAIKAIENASNVVIIAENLANIPTINYIFNASEAAIFMTVKTDIVIYLGGSIVSKQLKKYISNLEVPVIRVQTDNSIVDTFKNNIAIVQLSLTDAFESLADYFLKNKVQSTFSELWKTASNKAVFAKNNYLSKIRFSDMKVFEFLAKHIPINSIVHLANSTPVRYAQIMNGLFNSNCQFYSNRGVSGIDGSTSTAVGYAYLSEKINFLITGDLSFQYDSNAFFSKHLKGNLKVIIINNSGGNIFCIIDGPKDLEERADYFETSTQHHFSNLAKHFNLNYFSAHNEKELDDNWLNFVNANNNRPAVLEIFTDAKYSAEVFTNFHEFIQQQ